MKKPELKIINKIPTEYRNSSGIYSLTNKINGKRLMGSTLNFRKRLIMYHHKFRYNRMHNDHIYSALNKYGLNNFIFEMMCNCSKDSLLEVETFYCKIFDTWNRDKGYNIAIPTRPGELSKESRDKISKAKKGYKYSAKQRKYMSSVSKAYWKSEEGKLVRKTITESQKEFYKKKGHYTRIMPTDWRKNISKSNRIKKSKPVLQIDLNGFVIAEYSSAKEAQNKFNPNCSGHIGSVCNGGSIYKTAYGYKWRWKNEKQF